MIETVVALLMLVNGEIKEHRIQESMAKCLSGKRTAERNYNENVSTNASKHNHRQRDTWARSPSKQ